MTERIHLHEDDVPLTLDLLYRFATGRPGYERTATGAYIDWDELIPGTFSTSEIAVAHIARGLSILERHGGGAPARLRASIDRAIEGVVG